ncbi:MAG: histidine kinase [Alistipes sp.]|nr:histidine kinase [Alistipes sp.]
MKLRYSDWILNLLVAAAISTVVNFSYVLLLVVEQRGDTQQPAPARRQIVERPDEGVLHVTPDGHGYVVYENGDSVYAPMHRIHRLGLADGDRLVIDLMPMNRKHGAHPMLHKLRMRNGADFDYGTVFNRPSAATDISVQLLYYLLLSFVLLSVVTATRRNGGDVARASVVGVAVAATCYFVAPVIDWRSGHIVPNFSTGRMFDYMLLLKWTFAVVASLLYARIYTLISQRQAVELENEQLKNENLTTRYNLLVGQINPHFFFNSLNSLAMLVREKENEKALTYIDQLSYTFRYIIQNGQSTLMTLDEELKFVEAYGYLFKIRYADKLFIDMDVAPEYLDWRLPALSLQPLIGNAVKHNTITRANPFHISIRTEGSWLVVSNPKVPKLTPEPSTGIGLNNLCNRWRLITGCEVEIVDTEREFAVRMPLQSPAQS